MAQQLQQQLLQEDEPAPRAVTEDASAASAAGVMPPVDMPPVDVAYVAPDI
jgi:hypothetical protein